MSVDMSIQAQLRMIPACLPHSDFRRTVEKITDAAIARIEYLEGCVQILEDKTTEDGAAAIWASLSPAERDAAIRMAT